MASESSAWSVRGGDASLQSPSYDSPDEPARAMEWPIQQQVALFDSYPLDAGTEPTAAIPLSANGGTYPAGVGTLPTLPPTGRCLTSRSGTRGGAPKLVLRWLPSGAVEDGADGMVRRGPAPLRVDQSPWGSRPATSQTPQTARRPAAASSEAEYGRSAGNVTAPGRRQRPPSLPTLRRGSSVRETPLGTAAGDFPTPQRTASGSPPGSARGSRPGSSASPHSPSLSVHPAMVKTPQPPAAAHPRSKDGWMSRAEHEAAIRRALAELTVQFEAQLRSVRQDAVAMSPANSPAGSPLGSPKVSRPGSAALNTSCEGGRAMPSHRLNHPKWPYAADSRFDKAATPGATDGVLSMPSTAGNAASTDGALPTKTPAAPLVVVVVGDTAADGAESPGARSAATSATSHTTPAGRGGPRQSPGGLVTPPSGGRRPSMKSGSLGPGKSNRQGSRRGSVSTTASSAGAAARSGRRSTVAPGRRGSRGKASSERSNSGGVTGETGIKEDGTGTAGGAADDIDFQSWNFPSSRRPSGSGASGSNDTSSVAGRERAWREELEALMQKKAAADACYTKLLKLMHKQRSVNNAGSKNDMGTPTGTFKSVAGTPDSLSASDEEDIALPEAASSVDDGGRRKSVADLFTNTSAAQLTSAIMAAFQKVAAGARSPAPGSKRAPGASPMAAAGGGTERVKTAALKLVDKGRDISERLKRRTMNTEAIAHAVEKYEQQSVKETRAFEKNASVRAKKGPAVELKAAVFEKQCLGEVLPAAAIPVQCEKDVSSLKGLRGRYAELLGRVATLHEQHLAMVSTAASSAPARRDVIAEYEERARALPKPAKDGGAAADGDGDSGVAINTTTSFADASEDRRAANLRAALLSSEASMQPSLGFGGTRGSVGGGGGGTMGTGAMSMSSGAGAIGAGHRMHDILGANSRDIGVQNTIEDELLVYRHSRAAALLAKERAVTGAFRSLQTAMANIVAYTENLEVDISCHRCWKVLADPHVIAPCGITVCAACLVDTDDGMAADGTTLECGCTEHEGAVPNDTVTGAVEKWADLDRVATDLEYAVKNLGYKVQPCYESRSGTKGIVADGEPKVKDSKTRLLSAP